MPIGSGIPTVKFDLDFEMEKKHGEVNGAMYVKDPDNSYMILGYHGTYINAVSHDINLMCGDYSVLLRISDSTLNGWVYVRNHFVDTEVDNARLTFAGAN